MSEKYLVIVESYKKAPTIHKYLGKDYKVVSSGGHIRDLAKGSTGRGTKTPKTPKTKKPKLTPEQKLARKLSVDPYNHWQAHYEILPDKEKQLVDLKRHAKNKEVIFLATDLDREGEAIAWHLKEALGNVKAEFKRVVFSEITRDAIEKAFADPRELNMNRVRAQQTRRYLDRVVGFMLSPLLWQKVARGLSAGRVQSVAVRLIVEREHEIKSFVPEEYWQMSASFTGYDDFQAKVTHYDQKPYRPQSEEASKVHEQALMGKACEVVAREEKPKVTKPLAPFITSTLQQAASVRLKFGVKKTMMLAQRLYEAGFITYTRTDSTSVSNHARSQAVEAIKKQFGDDYLPTKPPVYTSKSNAQEAHECIRPSELTNRPGSLATRLDPDQLKLYDLIWRRFLASQMKPARYALTNLTIQHGKYLLKAQGKKILFHGFQRVLPPLGSATEDVIVPDMQIGDSVTVSQLFPTQHFTKPAPRYSEARFVAELEKRGIGRPSTYVPIISTIQERGYVKLDNNRFHALKMGELVSEKLTANFARIMDYGFTAKMEKELDEIAYGQRLWEPTLDEFFADFTEKLSLAIDNMAPATPTVIDLPCEKCGAKMAIKTGRTGVFLSCSTYGQPSKQKGADGKPKPPCRFTKSMQAAENFMETRQDGQGSGVRDEDLDVLTLKSQKRCPLCDTSMVGYVVDNTTMLHVCGKNPTCPGYEIQKGTFQLKAKEGPTVPCDRCDGTMHLKMGRFGKFFACDSCPNTRKVLKNGEIAPPKADPVPMPELPCEKSSGYFILRDGAAGIFLASSEFPRSRETKKPRVSDLARHRSELDSKHHFLADAPAKDPEGKDFVIRFSRKTKSYYLSSETDDYKKTSGKKDRKAKKPLVWLATYNGKSWDLKKDALTKKSSSSSYRPSKVRT